MNRWKRIVQMLMDTKEDFEEPDTAGAIFDVFGKMDASKIGEEVRNGSSSDKRTLPMVARSRRQSKPRCTSSTFINGDKDVS